MDSVCWEVKLFGLIFVLDLYRRWYPYNVLFVFEEGIELCTLWCVRYTIKVSMRRYFYLYRFKLRNYKMILIIYAKCRASGCTGC